MGEHSKFKKVFISPESENILSSEEKFRGHQWFVNYSKQQGPFSCSDGCELVWCITITWNDTLILSDTTVLVGRSGCAVVYCTNII